MRQRSIATLCLLIITAAATGPTHGQDLDASVERLTTEAHNLNELQDLNPPPAFKRPHPALQHSEAKQVEPVLTAMLKSYTGNDYLDTYIRWHQLHPILHVESDDLARQRDRIIRLINNTPPSIGLPRKDEGRHEPYELAREYFRLREENKVVIGYPPFERIHYGEAALKHAPPDRKAEIAQAVQRMKELRPQFKWIANPGAARYNDRLEKMDWLLRTYRGELIYLLLRTGDPSVPQVVVQEIETQLRSKKRTALDLLQYMYMAALNGDLARYDPKVMENAGRALERLARTAQSYEVYDTGQISRARYWSKRPRNFADYAFTLVNMLQSGSIYRLESDSP